MALEAIDVRREYSFALPKGAARWGPRIFHCSSLKAIFPFTVFWIAVGGSLCGMDARDDAAGRGLGASAKEMRD